MFPRAVVLGALLTASACVTSARRSTQTPENNPVVAIQAGRANLPGGYFDAYYIIEKRTQTCWMWLGAIGGQLDCCALRRVSEAQPHITWTRCPDEAQPSPASTPAASPTRAEPPTSAR